MRRSLFGRALRRLRVAWMNAPLARQTYIAVYSSTVVITAATFMLYISDTRRSVLEMERATMTSMFPMVERVVADAMIHESPEAIARLFAVHNAHGTGERMFLLDPDKRMVDTVDLASGRIPRREEPRAVDPDTHIIMDFPVPNRESCMRCHDPRVRTIGYVRLISPKRDRQAVAEANLKGRLIILFASFLVVGLWTLIIVRRVINEPIGRIAEAMGRLARGELGARVENLPSGELRQIAAGFNAMARRLEKDRREIMDLHRRQVAHMERLAAMGELSAHLAHEVRNPLTGISSTMQILQAEAPAGSPRRDVLTKVLVQLNRMEQTMGSFLRFARMPEAVVRPFRIHEPLGRVLDLLESRLRAQKVALARDVPEGLPELRGDPGQLEQVFLNLCINALHAMPHGGTLRVAARLEDGGSVLVEVGDTGVGIDAKHLESVFRPFFTTRENGSGLGLPLARQIVMAHDGEIWIESVPGKGTDIFVRLPTARSREPVEA